MVEPLPYPVCSRGELQSEGLNRWEFTKDFYVYYTCPLHGRIAARAYLSSARVQDYYPPMDCAGTAVYSLELQGKIWTHDEWRLRCQ